MAFSLPHRVTIDTAFAERTRIEYHDDVENLVAFLTGSCRLTAITAVDRTHLIRYLAALTTAGQAASTRRRAVAAIRLFFQVLVQEDLITRSPAQYLIPHSARTDRPASSRKPSMDTCALLPATIPAQQRSSN